MLDFCDVSLDDLYKWVRFNVDSGERLFNTVLSFGDINDKGLETADSGLKLAFKWDRSQDDRITTTALYSSGELSHESVNHILDEFEKSLRNIVETLEQPNADGIPYCISDLTKIEPQKPKIRIVCLHGYGSHAEHTRFMVGVLSARYDRLIEFICLQSPLEATDSGIAYLYPQGTKFYKWFDLDRERSEERVKIIMDYLAAEFTRIGPFDGLLGFSQSCAVVEMLDRLSLKGRFQRTWKFSILCSGTALSTRALPSYLTERIPQMPFPSIHLFSTNEKWILGDRLRNRYDPKQMYVLEHTAGHDLPRRNLEEVDEFAGAILDYADGRTRPSVGGKMTLFQNLASCVIGYAY